MEKQDLNTNMVSLIAIRIIKSVLKKRLHIEDIESCVSKMNLSEKTTKQIINLINNNVNRKC